MSLTDFLLERIAEDERRYSADPSEYGYGHAFRMAECEAKRRIVERHATCDDRSYGEPCPDLRDIASIYADHPDFREEWRS